MQLQLKEYQKKVLDDLKNYLDCVSKNNSLKDSWKNYWENNGKTVGFGAIPSYKNEIAGVPSVCVKVPTGGGKTFLACAALQKIFDALPREHKFVIWLVPSDAIFTQTLNALKNTNHPYRQKIDEDFQSKVMV
jgi:type III restriction enzyme